MEKKVTTYIASDLINVIYRGRMINMIKPLATNIVFKLLSRDHPLNTGPDSYKGTPSQPFRDFVNIYSQERRA